MDVFSMVMAIVLKELLGGNDNHKSITEKVFKDLEEYNFDSSEIQYTLDRIFDLEELLINDFLQVSMSHYIYDMYDPNKRIPIELIYGNSEYGKVDEEMVKGFNKLYSGKMAPEQFEVFVEGGEIAESIDF